MARKRKNDNGDNTTQENTVTTGLNLSALANSVEVAEALPARGSGGTDRFPDNPFVGLLRDSKNASKDRGRQVPVPAANVKEVTAAIRDAVDKLIDEQIGARIVYRFTAENGETVTTAKIADVPTEGDAQVLVMFEGKERKRYLSDEEKAEALRVGFARTDDPTKPDSAAYLRWVAAGRPMEGDDEEDDNGDDEEYDNGDNGPDGDVLSEGTEPQDY